MFNAIEPKNLVIKNMKKVDVLIIGAGAAGLFCGIEAGIRKRDVLMLDHANKLGKKILMSGGGRCNFTNLYIKPERYLSHNPHFCKSSLSRYTQFDFIELVKKHHIPFHEKTAGQLFCDNSSKDIVKLLLAECDAANVKIQLNTSISHVKRLDNGLYQVSTPVENYMCESLVIASGGLSIPTMGASPFGYKIAEQFGLKVWPTRAGLVPFTLQPEEKARFSELSGVSVNCMVSHQNMSFRENILFTHRGLSGPAILQISSYWKPGDEITINLLPELNILEILLQAQKNTPQKQAKSILNDYLPKRVVETFINPTIAEMKLHSLTPLQLKALSQDFQRWVLKPNATEGYRTAEVTLGGVDCNALSSKTMEVTGQPGLYFIGEVVDVTGWLGGYNFQWAWSSGWAAGQVV